MPDAPDELAPQSPLGAQLYPSWMRGAGEAVVGAAEHAAALPRRLIEQSESLRQGGEYDPAPAVETMGMLSGGATPFAESGAAGIFGGRLAQTANHAALARAEEMAGHGVHPWNIWASTGWFRGPEGKWRFEIPDNNLRMTREKLPVRGEQHAIEQDIEHPEAYAAYPQLKTLRSTVGQGPGAGSIAGRDMTVSAKNPQDAREIAAHELQHGVQEIEGFTPGTTPEAMRPVAERAGTVGYGVLPPGRPMTMDQLAYEIYRRTAGEVEARNVATRLDYTPLERARTPPTHSMDVPASDQVVLPVGR